MPSFQSLKSYFLASAGRPGRSTEPGVSRPSRSTNVHRMCTPVWLEGRSTARELLLSGKPRSTGPVDRQRVLLSVPGLGRPGRSTAGPTVRFLTVGGRPGRSTDSSPELLTGPQQLVFFGLYIGAPMDCFV